MYSIWTQNLKTDEEKVNFQSTLRGSKPVLTRLAEIIEHKRSDLSRSERSLKTYLNPSWAYEQAHKNGYDSALKNIQELLFLDQQKESNVTIQ